MNSLPENEGNGFCGKRDAEDAFLEHARRMKRFFRSHPTMLVVRIVRVHQMVPYDARHSLVETGGSAGVVDSADWPILAPLRALTGRQVWLN